MHRIRFNPVKQDIVSFERQTFPTSNFAKRSYAYHCLLRRESIENMPDAEFRRHASYLKSFALKGGRSIGILVLGMTALYFVNRRRVACQAKSAQRLSPTERYVQEMVDGGWPVDEADKKMISTSDAETSSPPPQN